MTLTDNGKNIIVADGDNTKLIPKYGLSIALTGSIFTLRSVELTHLEFIFDEVSEPVTANEEALRVEIDSYIQNQ